MNIENNVLYYNVKEKKKSSIEVFQVSSEAYMYTQIPRYTHIPYLPLTHTHSNTNTLKHRYTHITHPQTLSSSFWAD